ncbi:hypothetical protein OFY17_02420 [Marinomonas sp. C2222]|uniref:DUF4136 domain-containing protein n=1 Tax=Marinomonas sargassi TaxID=2984494 RepID=A0ABT2YPC5_9GAMM|nr:hypothetical protein [Marinomonas sargassi]MCV2401730.1 hypothetical protein [Marinomonas sargassi]
MNKVVWKLIGIVVAVLTMVGCATQSSNQNAYSAPKLNTTEFFYLNSISLVTEQFVTPDIEYHSESEIEEKVSAGVRQSLSSAGLLSEDTSMTTLDVDVVYQKRFVGDKTPITSDSLAYPMFDYTITVQNGAKEVSTISRKGLTYSGDFTMNLKVAGGRLRKKSDEEVFIKALVDSISETIQSFKK